MGELVFGAAALLAGLVFGLAVLAEPLGGPAPLLVFRAAALGQLFVFGAPQLVLVLISGAAPLLDLFVFGPAQLTLVLIRLGAALGQLFVFALALPGQRFLLVPPVLVFDLALLGQLLVLSSAQPSHCGRPRPRVSVRRLRSHTHARPFYGTGHRPGPQERPVASVTPRQ